MSPLPPPSVGPSSLLRPSLFHLPSSLCPRNAADIFLTPPHATTLLHCIHILFLFILPGAATAAAASLPNCIIFLRGPRARSAPGAIVACGPDALIDREVEKEGF